MAISQESIIHCCKISRFSPTYLDFDQRKQTVDEVFNFYKDVVVVNILCHLTEMFLCWIEPARLYLTGYSIWILISVDLEGSWFAHMVFCWVVYSIRGVFYFHTPPLTGSTLRAVVQTCSDRTGCAVPFSSMNYRQRACSLQPQQSTSQTQQKLTALVLFWKHALNMTV